MKNVTIGVACDGFTIIIADKEYSINQEDDPGEKLKELFLDLGYKVKLEGWY